MRIVPVYKKSLINMDDKIKEEDLWCEYSDLPSPKAYIKCADYDSMGNHGRFPMVKQKKGSGLKNLLKKIMGRLKKW